MVDLSELLILGEILVLCPLIRMIGNFLLFEVDQLDKEFGPFEIDATSDETGSNAHFAKFWHAKDDCRTHDWAGLNVFCNLPFSIMLSIILHFIKSKLRSPLGTSATFVVPAWLAHDALRLIIEMPSWFRRVRIFSYRVRSFHLTKHVFARWGA
jgi:hypothetical protein